MTMYRHLLQTVVPLTSGVVAKSAEHLTVVLKRMSGPCASFGCALTSVRRHSGMTYSRWHHLRKAAVSSSSRRLSHQQQFEHHTYTAASSPSSSPTPECSERVREVCEKYHDQLKAGQLKANDTVEFTSALCSAVYSSLSILPWLHSENHIIAYMQILMNGRTRELLTEPLYSCPHFRAMYDHIDATVAEIPGQNCPSVLLSLIYSGLEQTDPLVARLLSRCNDAVPEMSIPQLRDSAHIMQSLGNRDFIFSEKLVGRLKDLLTDSRDTEAARFEIKDLCVSSPVLAAYMSQELLERCIAAMLLKAEQQSPHLDIVTIGFCFRYSRKMGFRADRENLHKLSTLAKAALDRFTDYDQLQSHHIAEVCHNAKRLGLYTGPVVERMQQRSLQLLRRSGDTLHIREITNLMFAFKQDISPEVKQELCNLLLRTLGDADVLTLSNIADNLLELDMVDPQLMTLFQSKVRHNINNIAMFITRLVKVLRLLRERLDHDVTFNHQMCETLLRLLSRRQGYDPTFVVVVAQFILPNIRTVMPAVLTECLMNIIPRCNLSLMLLILNGLDKMRGAALSRSLHNQVLQLRFEIQQNIGEQLDNATHASQLAELIRGLHIRSQNRDFVLLDKMMGHFPRLTKSMSRHDYMRTVQVLKHLSHPYHHPDVFEDLISFAKAHYSQVTFFGVLDLVNVLAQAGYRPQDFQDFSTFIVQVVDDAVKEGNTLGQVVLTHYLSLMQIFPDHVLEHIFTFPFLEQVDSLIEAEPNRQMFLRSLMMQLNRCAILECPHLDVPWFHDDFCQQLARTFEGRDFQKNMAFVEEVDSALREVMRGGECVGHNVYSPYFHPIDFEIVFDAKGEAIPTATLKRINPDEFGFRRLALKLIGNQQLCANSHRRRGVYLRDRRHLEILGYRVEEITRYDWNSMALSDWGSKVNHVRSKIFQTPSTSTPSKELRQHPVAESSTMHPYWK